MVHILKTDFNFGDDRGTITQLVHSGYKQVNVISSKKGVVRGGHYHKQNKEAFYIVYGALSVTVEDETYHFKTGDFFGIDEYDMHSFVFEEETLLVSMYSDGVELPDGTKDIFTDK